MMLKPGTYLQDRYEILSLIGYGRHVRGVSGKMPHSEPSGGDQGFKG